MLGGATRTAEIDTAEEVRLPSKKPRSRTRIRRPRLATVKAKPRVDRTGKARANPKKSLPKTLRRRGGESPGLPVASLSHGELETALQAVLEDATRMCEAEFSSLYLRGADAFHVAAVYNAPPGFAEACASLADPHWDTAFGRVVATKEAAQIV